MTGFAGARVVVVGLAVTGRAAARVLLEEGADVIVTETRPDEELDEAHELQELGARIAAGGHVAADLDGADLVVTSPGVPQNADVLRWASDRGIPILSELELGARLCTVPFVAVTGTNGKSTTTEMIAGTMRASGLDAVACGNIGYPLVLAARAFHDALAVEASSFQLRFADGLHPRVSVLLNIAEDHLDWHGSMRSYAAAKARIFEHQRGNDVHVGNADDPAAAAISRGAPCAVRWFTLAEPSVGEVGYVDGELVSMVGPGASLGRIRGDIAGFRADSAAAAAAALAFGIEPDAVERGLAETEPLRHRGETVATVGGVRFVDNSKATNVHAALAALEDFDEAVLIAGGDAKGADLSGLGAAAPRLGAVVALGSSADAVIAAFEGRVRTARAGSIEEATRLASTLASAGTAVVLAPACASWDMFTDYRERGDRFTAAAIQLEKEVTPLG